MKKTRKAVIWVSVVVVVGLLVTATLVIRARRAARRPITLKGAVITQASDSRKELPIADVDISPEIQAPPGDDSTSLITKSDGAGFFWMRLPVQIKRGQKIVLRFRHSGYDPLDAMVTAGDELYIAHMAAKNRQEMPPPNHPVIKVSNVRVRYTVKTYTTVDVGSVVKTFEVQNTGNTPCHGRPPCSPDGKWKASIASTTMDAGIGNEFRNARVSCMAGPCPFTKIESDGFSRGGRTIAVAVRNWSDTATYLVEAEVVHPTVSDLVRDSYPLVFGQVFNFSLAASAEGPSVEAELNGESIVFPMGPSLCLSWADCSLTTGRDQSKAYRCELKPGYSFP